MLSRRLATTGSRGAEPRRLEADTAGFYHSELWNRDHPKIQILTIKDLLEEGKRPDLPPFVASPYQKAERVRERAEAPRLL